MLEAAIDGQGVAISRQALVADDLAKGLLVKPFEMSAVHEWDYWVVCPPHALERPKVAAFCAWMREEAARQTRAFEESGPQGIPA
jgi:LysR family glycine cleavage system transcriptional activator